MPVMLPCMTRRDFSIDTKSALRYVLSILVARDKKTEYFHPPEGLLHGPVQPGGFFMELHMNEITVFQNLSFGSVRTILKEGDPWFVAKDVAAALGYSDSSIRQASNLFQAVPDEWKGLNQIKTPGGWQDVQLKWRSSVLRRLM